MNKITYILLLGLMSCYVGEELPPDQEVWEYAHPSKAGLNDRSLLDMDSAITMGNYNQINGIIIIKDDQLVFENYYNFGARNEAQPIGRVTFSVLTLALDLFIQDGYVHPDEPIYHYLPEYETLFANDSLKQLITIRHLIAFKAGLVWSESTGIRNDLAPAKNKADGAEYVLAKPMEAPPGYRTVLNSGAGIVLARILQNQLGDRPLLDYLKDNFFSKIGIEEVVWEEDSTGTLNGGNGLSLTTMDLTRIGYLMLNEGRWLEKKRVISRDWIFTITTEKTKVDNYYSYGYTWWLFTDNFNQSVLPLGENSLFFAAGESGQHLYVIPGENMVVCILAENYNLSFANSSLFLFIKSMESLQPALAN